MATFAEYGGGPRFTFEVPPKKVLQSLDLSLQRGDTHVGRILSTFQGRHSRLRFDPLKIVKTGIALTCLGSAIKSRAIILWQLDSICKSRE